MTPTAPRGFTLIELLAALVLGLLVSGATYQLVLNGQRAAHAQAEQVSLQDNVRSGLLFLGNELREIGYSEITADAAAALGLPGGAIPDADLIAIGPDSITYRALRAVGFTCSLDGATGDAVLRSGTYHALRAPTASDSMLLYVENVAATSTDDAWLRAAITAAPAAQSCPDGEPGLRFRVALASLPAGLTTAVVLSKMVVGGPVRTYEVVQVRSYQSGGSAWLGMRSVSAGATLQPIVGPLSDGTGAEQGLQLSYRDGSDNVTGELSDVRGIEATLVGITAEPVHGWGTGPAAVDTLALTTRVSLRNARRP